MARQTKAEKLIDTVVEAAYGRNCSGVQFDIFDVGKVMDAGRAAARAGTSVDDAMIAAVAKYRKN